MSVLASYRDTSEIEYVNVLGKLATDVGQWINRQKIDSNLPIDYGFQTLYILAEKAYLEAFSAGIIHEFGGGPKERKEHLKNAYRLCRKFTAELSLVNRIYDLSNKKNKLWCDYIQTARDLLEETLSQKQRK